MGKSVQEWLVRISDCGQLLLRVIVIGEIQSCCGEVAAQLLIFQEGRRSSSRARVPTWNMRPISITACRAVENASRARNA
jgi:hypothetical protein